MPQLDILTFKSQLVTVFILFTFLFLFSSLVLLPRLFKIMKYRHCLSGSLDNIVNKKVKTAFITNVRCMSFVIENTTNSLVKESEEFMLNCSRFALNSEETYLNEDTTELNLAKVEFEVAILNYLFGLLVIEEDLDIDSFSSDLDDCDFDEFEFESTFNTLLSADDGDDNEEFLDEEHTIINVDNLIN